MSDLNGHTEKLVEDMREFMEDNIFGERNGARCPRPLPPPTWMDSELEEDLSISHIQLLMISFSF